MCMGNPQYHPCSHTSVLWFYCQMGDHRRQRPCANQNFLRGNESTDKCTLKSCKFSGRGKGWVCCQCQGGPNYTGWCSMPSLASAGTFKSSWPELGTTTCDHVCCKRCVKVKGKQQLPLSTSCGLQKPTDKGQAGMNSSSLTSRSSARSSSSSSSSGDYYNSPPSSSDGSYTGHFGPPDAALRDFYDKYVPHGTTVDAEDESDWNSIAETHVNECWAESPAEQIPVQTMTVHKKRKDKSQEPESRSKKSKSSKKSQKSRR